jgi:hypothetical protein
MSFPLPSSCSRQSTGVCFSPCCAQRRGDFRDWLLPDFMFCARRGTPMRRPSVLFRRDSWSGTACFNVGLSFWTCAHGVMLLLGDFGAASWASFSRFLSARGAYHRHLCSREQVPRPPLFVFRQWGDIKLPPPYVSGVCGVPNVCFQREMHVV